MMQISPVVPVDLKVPASWIPGISSMMTLASRQKLLTYADQQLLARDWFEDPVKRRNIWGLFAIPALIGLIGDPTLNPFSQGTILFQFSAVCGAVTLVGCGICHTVNAARCGRRRSIIEGPLFFTFGLLIVAILLGFSGVDWDTVGNAALGVWLIAVTLDWCFPSSSYLRWPWGRWS